MNGLLLLLSLSHTFISTKMNENDEYEYEYEYDEARLHNALRLHALSSTHTHTHTHISWPSSTRFTFAPELSDERKVRETDRGRAGGGTDAELRDFRTTPVPQSCTQQARRYSLTP